MSDDLSSKDLVAMTQELHDIWRRVNELREPLPAGDADRAFDALIGAFPKVFMELRDQIGCAVLREARR